LHEILSLETLQQIKSYSFPVWGSRCYSLGGKSGDLDH